MLKILAILSTMCVMNSQNMHLMTVLLLLMHILRQILCIGFIMKVSIWEKQMSQNFLP